MPEWWSSLCLDLLIIHQTGSLLLGDDSGLMQTKPSSSPICSYADRLVFLLNCRRKPWVHGTEPRIEQCFVFPSGKRIGRVLPTRTTMYIYDLAQTMLLFFIIIVWKKLIQLSILYNILLVQFISDIPLIQDQQEVESILEALWRYIHTHCRGGIIGPMKIWVSSRSTHSLVGHSNSASPSSQSCFHSLPLSALPNKFTA